MSRRAVELANDKAGVLYDYLVEDEDPDTSVPGTSAPIVIFPTSGPFLLLRDDTPTLAPTLPTASTVVPTNPVTSSPTPYPSNLDTPSPTLAPPQVSESVPFPWLGEHSWHSGARLHSGGKSA